MSGRDPRPLLAVAGWVGVVAGVVCVLAGVVVLTESGEDVAGLGPAVFLVLAVMGGVGIALAVTVLRLRSTRTRAAAVVGLVLGLAVIPIWNAGMGVLSAPLPAWVGVLQLPVPLVVIGLSVVALVWSRRTTA